MMSSFRGKFGPPVSELTQAESFNRVACRVFAFRSGCLYTADCTKTTFRQEQFFRYLFGVNEPDLYGLLDLKRREAVLFFPWTSPDYQR